MGGNAPRGFSMGRPTYSSTAAWPRAGPYRYECTSRSFARQGVGRDAAASVSCAGSRVGGPPSTRRAGRRGMAKTTAESQGSGTSTRARLDFGGGRSSQRRMQSATSLGSFTGATATSRRGWSAVRRMSRAPSPSGWSTGTARQPPTPMIKSVSPSVDDGRLSRPTQRRGATIMRARPERGRSQVARTSSTLATSSSGADVSGQPSAEVYGASQVTEAVQEHDAAQQPGPSRRNTPSSSRDSSGARS